MNLIFPNNRILAILLVFLLVSGDFCWAWVPNSQEKDIASYLASDPNQKRPELVFDPILAEVARARAADMAARGYFGHVNPDGVAANYLVRKTGYILPAWWGTDPKDNYIESIAAGYGKAHDVWMGWMGSVEHRTHLLGLDKDGFFAAETHYGIGYVYAPGSKSVYYWVVITAPPGGITISSPHPKDKLSSDSAIVQGTTPAGLPVASVTAQIENQFGSSVPTLASGTSDWNVTLHGFAAGQNLIRVQAKNASGEVISEDMVAVTYTETCPLIISTSGSGSVSAAFSGTTSREVGKTYQVEAIPAKGFLFSGWSGGIQSTSAKLKFTMPEGLTLQANFVATPFPSAKGTYNGLMISGTDGLLKLNLNSNGTFSGKVFLGQSSNGFTGRFSALGQADVIIKRKGQSSLILHLTLDVNGSQEITGTLTDGTLASSFIIDLDVFGKNNPAPQAGHYTFAFLPQNTSEPSPTGSSIGSLQIDGAGKGVFSGRLADNTRFSCTTTLSRDGSLPLYFLLPNHRGQVSGLLKFENLPSSDATGKIQWNQSPAEKDPLYPLGFGLVMDAIVSSYGAQVAAVPLLNPISVVDLRLIDNQGAALVDIATTTSTTGLIVFAETPPAQLKLSTNTKTGTISGSFLSLATNSKCTIRAVYLQKQGAAFGYFTGKGAVGSFSLLPSTQ